jgi:Antitoxin Phd_YefM, type II toxin-antitoxin system
MTTVALGEAKDKLSEYVTSVERTHDRIVVTRHGRPLSLSLPTTWLPRGDGGYPRYARSA